MAYLKDNVRVTITAKDSFDSDSNGERGELAKYFKSRKPTSILRAIIVCVLPFSLVAILVSISVLGSLSGHSYEGPYGCDATGTVWMEGVNWNPIRSIWMPLSALRITLPFGRMPFEQAKAIDVIWDLIVGRGSHAALVLFIYRLFREAFADVVKNEGMTQEQILATQYSTSSPSSLWIYAKACFGRREGRSRKFSFQFLVLTASVAYALILPTWLSVMTGYSAVMEPYLNLEHDGNDSVPFDRLSRCYVVVMDGPRVGLPENTCIPEFGLLYMAVARYMHNDQDRKCYTDRPTQSWVSQSLSIYHKTIKEELDLSQRKHCNNASTFQYLNKTHNLPSPMLYIAPVGYKYNGQTYLGKDLVLDGVCQTTGVYQWGFSFFILFIFAAVTLGLSMAWCVISYQHGRCLWPEQVDMVFGKFRSAIVVANSMRTRLGDCVDTMTDKELLSALEARQATVGFNDIPADIMSAPGPERPKAENPDYPVGSDRYKAYLRDGSAQLAQEYGGDNICKTVLTTLKDWWRSIRTRNIGP